ncbi:hypothetical protein PTTG_08495 [Puccinia triticina 1-1 BBBD Race 1]|uniref:No apical meristem-associated C-terminal domain-containing protein n=1 Tax=Puccinia triticina (isolate 1-1 / race 1 (BBBD)) TaxID=630390 RepID=A0A0C4F5U1_PUCT1|nr:hypothetical protein PTTG_08495 [Puccinia triticina 1-1 BBBD Race 1]
MACGTNFINTEDVQLARSWLHISQSQISNSMKMDHFWKEVANHFNENSAGQEQDSKSLRTRLFLLKSRWAGLRLAVTKFCGIYTSIEKNPPSGSSPSNWITQAKMLFQDQAGKGFSYQPAWMELRNVACFQSLNNDLN